MKQLTSLDTAFPLLLVACSSARAAIRFQAGDGSTPSEPTWWGFDSELPSTR